jgi:hypothetical protein
LAVESGNCLLRLGRIRHFDKGEAAGTTGIAIGNHAYLIDFPVGFKQGP